MTRMQLVADLQRHWWAVGLVGTLVGALGFQTMSPAHRLAEVEKRQALQVTVDARQDSALAAHVREKQHALEDIQRQLNALIAGQCVAERNAVARLAYGCSR